MTGSSRQAAARSVDRGSGTVLMVAASGVVVALTAAGLHLGAAAAAAHRARAAADLSALAAASSVQSGVGDPCTVAGAVARRNDVRLRTCLVVGAGRVFVRVSAAAATAWPGVPRDAVASALAGPAEVDPHLLAPAR